jgi:hypothetical protein
VREIAEQFVDLVLRYECWSQVQGLPHEEVQILFHTVSAAGFNPQAIAHGKVKDESQFPTPDCAINVISPYKVVDKTGEDHCFATGWLDCALRLVLMGKNLHDEPRDKIIDTILSEILRSVPLQPILLDSKGDILWEHPRQPLAPSREVHGLVYFVAHTRDADGLHLNACVGVHLNCTGYMDRFRATDIFDCLTCRKCNLRVFFPKEIQTYGDLRQYFIEKLQGEASAQPNNLV